MDDLRVPLSKIGVGAGANKLGEGGSLHWIPSRLSSHISSISKESIVVFSWLFLD